MSCHVQVLKLTTMSANGFKALLLLAPMLILVLALEPALAAEPELFQKIEKELEKEKINQDSVDKLTSYLEEHPRSSDGYKLMGRILIRMGLQDQAYEMLHKAVEYGPDNPEAIVELAKAEIQKGHTNAGLALVDQGLKKFPDNPEMLVIVADYLIDKLNKRREGRRLLLKASRIKDDIKGLNTSLAKLALSTNYWKAINLATKDLARYPNYDRALRVRGLAFRRVRLYKNCIDDLSKVYEKNPSLKNINIPLAESYIWQGDYKKALGPAIYTLAYTAKPEQKNTPHVVFLAKIVKKLPRETFFDRLEPISEDIEKRMNTGAFYYQLGTMFDLLHDRENAIKMYKTAVERKHDLVLAWYRMALDLELYEKQYSAALECLNKAHNLRPFDNEIGIAYIRLHNRLAREHADVSGKWKKWFQNIKN